jgi:hypothetical protein
MSGEESILVNENVICILKKAPNNNLLILDFEPIERTLDNDFMKMVKMVSKPAVKIAEVYFHISQNPRLRVLFEKYDYCKILHRPWQEAIPLMSFTSFQKKYPLLHKSDLIKRQKKELLQDLEYRLKAFYLNKSIKNAENKRRQQELIAYSHRRIGWSTPVYHLKPSFSVDIKTNFGYGSVSYFYTRFKYKNVNIIPFSQWVEYEYADKFELIRYSSNHEVNNESWIDAFQYARNACNLSLTDEPLFIKKYMIDECEKMVTGLEVFLTNSSFKFLNQKNRNTYTRYRRPFTRNLNMGSDMIERIYTDSHKKGHGLIEFRGEKISGSLDFIQEIATMKEVIEIEGFVKRIIKCNKTIKPILTNEIKLIRNELKPLVEKFKVEEPKFKEAQAKKNMYIEERELLRKKLIEEHGEPYMHDFIDKNYFSEKYPNLKPIQDLFLKMFPEYQSFTKRYKEIYKRYKTLKDQIDSLKIVQKNITSYKKAIEDFFQKKHFVK